MHGSSIAHIYLPSLCLMDMGSVFSYGLTWTFPSCYLISCLEDCVPQHSLTPCNPQFSLQFGFPGFPGDLCPMCGLVLHLHMTLVRHPFTLPTISVSAANVFGTSPPCAAVDSGISHFWRGWHVQRVHNYKLSSPSKRSSPQHPRQPQWLPPSDWYKILPPYQASELHKRSVLFKM